MIVLLPHWVTQSMVSMAISVYSLMQLRMKVSLLQGIFVRGSVFELFEFLVRFSAD